MKIAFVYDMVYPFKIGGVEKRIWELSRRLSARGHEVHVFGLKMWEGPPDILQEGVHLHGVCRPMPFHTGESGRRTILPALWLSLFLFFPLLRKGRFDVIECQNFPYFPCFPAWLAAALKKSLFVVTWHEVWGPYWHDYLGRAGGFGFFIERLVKRLTCYHVSVSSTTSKMLRHHGAKGHIFVVPNGVDLERIRGIQPSPERSDTICIGRLIPDKHVDVLIAAIALLKASIPEIQCIIVGRGPEEEKLKAQVLLSGLENNIRFTGFVRDQDDILALMKASRVCVLPSTREGFGMVALEALACGIPVVTADHPGNAIRDLKEIGGVRAVPLTVQEFAVAIRETLQSSTPPNVPHLEGAWDWDAVTGQWLKMVDGFRRMSKVNTSKGSLSEPA
ncbi:MAG TPA: glycosyltransferase family 4 protein [Methanolinea sp.]|nr:glycosyltransferase family 4 protein [Methanolinea sp.]HQK56298.1 glycosyltransferase family 4 protein [Methanolinea sp.]